MITLLKKAPVGLAAAALALALLSGCSGSAGGSQSSSRPLNASSSGIASSASSSPASATSSGSASKNTPLSDAAKSLLSSIKTLAVQGKVIDCDFAAQHNTIDDVINQWGKPDSSDYVASAKGTYATYNKYGLVFGYNKGEQIFEVRSLETQLSEITLSGLKATYGKPDYDDASAQGEIVGYISSTNFKLLFVFHKATAAAPDPALDHYSVLYPAGTANLMAGDSGRQW
jgi:hypothetical protein